MAVKVAIVPAGQWGTALAVPLARRGHQVWLWFRSQAAADGFNSSRENRGRLKGVTFPANVTGTADLEEAVAGAELVVLAPASSGLRTVCRAIAPLLGKETILLSVVKALFAEGPSFVSGVVGDELPAAVPRFAVLSGPNFAVEVARELPAGTVVASRNAEVARRVQHV